MNECKCVFVFPLNKKCVCLNLLADKLCFKSRVLSLAVRRALNYCKTVKLRGRHCCYDRELVLLKWIEMGDSMLNRSSNLIFIGKLELWL